MKNFSSGQPAGDEQEVAEFEFRLDKVPFTVVLRSDADSVLEWSEMVAGATDEDLESAAGVAFISRFFRLVMEPAEYTRFRAHMKARKTPVGVLTDIMGEVQDQMEDLIEEDTERPTQPSSPSSGGRDGRAARLSLIASLPDGDVVGAEAPVLTGPTPEQWAAMHPEAAAADDGEFEVLGKWQPGVPLDQQVPVITSAPVRPPSAQRARPSGKGKRRRAG